MPIVSDVSDDVENEHTRRVSRPLVEHTGKLSA